MMTKTNARHSSVMMMMMMMMVKISNIMMLQSASIMQDTGW